MATTSTGAWWKEESRAVAFREIVFESVSRHIEFPATINDNDLGRAEPPGLGGGVDRGVPATDDRDARADRDLVERLGMDLLDESESVDHFGQVLTRNAEPLAVAEADSDKNGVETFELFARHIFSHFHSAAKLHA